MADAFKVDPDQAQQLSETLFSVGGRLAAERTSGPQAGNTGSGMLESAMSEFSTAVMNAQQNLATAVDNSAKNFASLASGTVSLDQQQAANAERV